MSPAPRKTHRPKGKTLPASEARQKVARPATLRVPATRPPASPPVAVSLDAHYARNLVERLRSLCRAAQHGMELALDGHAPDGAELSGAERLQYLRTARGLLGRARALYPTIPLDDLNDKATRAVVESDALLARLTAAFPGTLERLLQQCPGELGALVDEGDRAAVSVLSDARWLRGLLCVAIEMIDHAQRGEDKGAPLSCEARFRLLRLAHQALDEVQSGHKCLDPTTLPPEDAKHWGATGEGLTMAYRALVEVFDGLREEFPKHIAEQLADVERMRRKGAARG